MGTNRIRTREASRDVILEGGPSSGQTIVDDILERPYRGRWATVVVKRNKENVTISWRFHLSAGSPKEYGVLGGMREITFIPEPKHPTARWICDVIGNGKVELQLEQGSAYHFRFSFYRMEEEVGEPHVDILYAQIIVPLSDERKALLRKTVLMESDPEARIRHEAELVLTKEDAFDDARREGIARIKTKRLTPKEEKRRIERFISRIEFMKEEFGL